MLTRCVVCGAKNLHQEYRTVRGKYVPLLCNEDGSSHSCMPDTIECLCSHPVLRYPDGHKMNMDGSPHICVPLPASAVPKKAIPASNRHVVSQSINVYRP